MDVIRKNNTCRAVVTSIANDDEDGEVEGDVGQELEDIPANIMDLNDRSNTVIGKFDASNCSIFEDDGLICFILMSYRAATSYRLFSHRIESSRYTVVFFYESMLDTGCLHIRMGGMKQCRDYCCLIGFEKAVNISNIVICKFSAG